MPRNIFCELYGGNILLVEHMIRFSVGGPSKPTVFSNIIRIMGSVYSKIGNFPNEDGNDA